MAKDLSLKPVLARFSPVVQRVFHKSGDGRENAIAGGLSILESYNIDSSRIHVHLDGDNPQERAERLDQATRDLTVKELQKQQEVTLKIEKREEDLRIQRVRLPKVKSLQAELAKAHDQIIRLRAVIQAIQDDDDAAEAEARAKVEVKPAPLGHGVPIFHFAGMKLKSELRRRFDDQLRMHTAPDDPKADRWEIKCFKLPDGTKLREEYDNLAEAQAAFDRYIRLYDAKPQVMTFRKDV